MPKLSIISTYYNHPEMVQAQIAHWESLPRSLLSEVEFILVDDCSEQPASFRPSVLDLNVFRVITPIEWNTSGARNLAATHARADWLLFFDIDQRFFADGLAVIAANVGQFDPLTMYHLRAKNIVDNVAPVPVTLASHTNTALVNARTFKAYGMYDEDFCGHYGFNDLYMMRVWELRGGKQALLNNMDYFEDLGFETSGLSRDVSRNQALAQEKLRLGAPSATAFLRFAWERVEVGRLQEALA